MRVNKRVTAPDSTAISCRLLYVRKYIVVHFHLYINVVHQSFCQRFGSIVCQIGTKWDKSGTFKVSHIRNIFSLIKNVLRCDLKMSRNIVIWLVGAKPI